MAGTPPPLVEHRTNMWGSPRLHWAEGHHGGTSPAPVPPPPNRTEISRITTETSAHAEHSCGQGTWKRAFGKTRRIADLLGNFQADCFGSRQTCQRQQANRILTITNSSKSELERKTFHLQTASLSPVQWHTFANISRRKHKPHQSCTAEDRSLGSAFLFCYSVTRRTEGACSLPEYSDVKTLLRLQKEINTITHMRGIALHQS